MEERIKHRIREIGISNPEAVITSCEQNYVVDHEDLKAVTDDQWKVDLGVTAVGDLNKIKKMVRHLRAPAPAGMYTTY